MKQKALPFLALIFLISSCINTKAQSKKSPQQPNIIYILADDLGYGDLGCYGQEIIKTPHIDKMATRGMKFTQHYSGAAVCAPARSSLMTGLHTGHTPIRGNRELGGEGQTPIPAEYLTIAELMKNAGYATGAFGKWGLGFIGSEGDAINQGFDEFYGYNCQRMAHRYYPPYLWHNRDTAYLAGNDWTNTVTYAPDEIQKETLKFLEDNKDKPFFAYVPLVLPHAELITPEDSIYQIYAGKFEETPFQLPRKYLSDYGPDIVFKEYASQKNPKAVYATMVTRLDAYVGEIMDKLDELGIADNTFVIFTSDNGPHTESGYVPADFNSAGGLRGVKRDLYEGGIRAPMIAVYPNKIKANSNSTHLSAFWDMMPTLADLTGQKSPKNTDGISILPTLVGNGQQEIHDYLYWEYQVKGGRQAIREGDWKLVKYKLSNPKKMTVELFNIAEDEKEKNDLAAKYPERVEAMVARMGEVREPSDLFPLIRVKK